MHTIFRFGFSFLVFSLFITSVITLQSCEPDEPDDPVDYKPNIYIYPTSEMQLDVSLNFPLGGSILTSIPEYGDGWHVSVDTNGIIDGKYEYLFYESKQADVWQKDYGWVIEKSGLKDFFSKNLSDYGFQGREITDFTEYWIPKLKDSDFYEIFPQDSKIIDTAIELKLSEKPENILRMHYFIRGKNKLPRENPKEPTNPKLFDRKGFYVTEWGVIME